MCDYMVTKTIGLEAAKGRAKGEYDKRPQGIENYRKESKAYLEAFKKRHVVADEAKIVEIISRGSSLEIWKALETMWLKTTPYMKDEQQRQFFLEHLSLVNEHTIEVVCSSITEHYIRVCRMVDVSSIKNDWIRRPRDV